jgi:hypothetical protein
VEKITGTETADKSAGKSRALADRKVNFFSSYFSE